MKSSRAVLAQLTQGNTVPLSDETIETSTSGSLATTARGDSTAYVGSSAVAAINARAASEKLVGIQ